MIGDVNLVVLSGVVKKQPKNISKDQNRCIAVFDMQSSSRWYDGTGKPSEPQTYLHNVVVLDRNNADFVMRHIKEGDHILVEGSVIYREVTNDKGYKKMLTNICSGYGQRMQLLTSAYVRQQMQHQMQQNMQQPQQAPQAVQQQPQQQQTYQQQAAPYQAPATQYLEPATQQQQQQPPMQQDNLDDSYSASNMPW